LIADIHFDYRLALAPWRLASMAAAQSRQHQRPWPDCRCGQIGEVPEGPIRIGVNAGSLPKKPARGSVAQRMVAARWSRSISWKAWISA